MLESGTRTLENRNLIDALKALRQASPHTFRFRHVPGHADIAGNERADRAAGLGSAASARQEGTPIHARGTPIGFLTHVTYLDSIRDTNADDDDRDIDSDCDL